MLKALICWLDSLQRRNITISVHAVMEKLKFNLFHTYSLRGIEKKLLTTELLYSTKAMGHFDIIGFCIL